MTLIPGIKQISPVGNDMYIQGAFPVSIATTNVDYLADPADTRLLAGRDPVIDGVSVGMSGVESDLKYATGAQPLTVTDAVQGNLKYCEVQFSPKQDLHGYDKPWPAGGYKNIIPSNASAWEQGAIYDGGSYSDSDSRIRIINKYVIKPNTMYTLSVYGDIVPAFHLWRADNSYISDSSWITSLPYTFTTPNDAAIIAVTCRSSIGYFDPISPDIMGDTAFIQIEEGGSATEWTPYENICPISGTDTVNVYVAEYYDPAAAPEATVSLGAERYGGTAELVSGTGSEAYGYYQFAGNEQYVQLTNRVAIKTAVVLPSTSTGLCTDFQFNATGATYYIYLDTTMSAEDVKTYMGQHTVYCVYALDTPTPYDFPGAHDITLQDGTNTIWSDTNGTDISVTYVTKK